MKAIRLCLAWLALGIIIGPFGAHQTRSLYATCGRVHVRCLCGGERITRVRDGRVSYEGGSCVVGRIARWGGIKMGSPRPWWRRGWGRG